MCMGINKLFIFFSHSRMNAQLDKVFRIKRNQIQSKTYRKRKWNKIECGVRFEGKMSLSRCWTKLLMLNVSECEWRKKRYIEVEVLSRKRLKRYIPFILFYCLKLKLAWFSNKHSLQAKTQKESQAKAATTSKELCGALLVIIANSTVNIRLGWAKDKGNREM